MSVKKQEATTRVIGRISRDPQSTTTMSGVAICRLTVVKEASGPASSPVVVNLYMKGDLAHRCARKLGVGDLIEGSGDLAPMRRRARFPEILTEQVRLHEEVSGKLKAAA